MRDFDYSSKVEKTKKRIEWLKVQLIASQHHECYNLTEQIKKNSKMQKKNSQNLSVYAD